MTKTIPVSEQNRHEHCKPCRVVVHCMCGCRQCVEARVRAREPDKEHRVIDHQRLVGIVVKAAKARRSAERAFDANPSTAPALMAAELAEDAAIDDLTVYEAQHQIGE